MAWSPDDDLKKVIEVAKRATAPAEKLSASTLLAAVVHRSRLQDRLSKLSKYLPEPKSLREDAAAQVDVNDEVVKVLEQLRDTSDKQSLEAFVFTLLFSPAGKSALTSAGMPEAELAQFLEEIRPQIEPRQPANPPPASRESAALQQAMEAIGQYGRLLTQRNVLPPRRGSAEMDGAFLDLYAALSRNRWPSVAIVGPLGSGKSKLVYELARRLIEQDPTIPARLRNLQIFELNVNSLRAASQTPYETRLANLFGALAHNRNLVLYCDDLESLLLRHDVPMVNALQRAVTTGEGRIIVCARTETFQELAVEFPEILSCFAQVKTKPTDKAATVKVLNARRAYMDEIFAPLKLPEPLMASVADLAEQYLPPIPCEPKRSIDLLDRACAEAVSRVPAPAELSIEHVHEAVFDQTGFRVGMPPTPISLGDGKPATQEQIAAFLKSRVMGQDAVLDQIARALQAINGPFSAARRGPLGVYMFAGPTGVGKTETALALSELRGGGKPALIRVDCNTLAGTDEDKTPMLWRLFGVQKGYRGMGEGNLSAIRNNPASVVLFDELEKANFAIYKILLQIMDHGEVRDSQENLLDFRQSIIVFTTNAGVDYGPVATFGLRKERDVAPAAPRTTAESVITSFQRMGYGMEFFGRLQLMVFQPLDDSDAERVLLREFGAIRQMVEKQGRGFEWEAVVPPTLVKRHKGDLGVRHLIRIVQRQVLDQLNIAAARGELEKVKLVKIALMPEPAEGLTTAIGASDRKIDGATLWIYVS